MRRRRCADDSPSSPALVLHLRLDDRLDERNTALSRKRTISLATSASEPTKKTCASKPLEDSDAIEKSRDIRSISHRSNDWAAASPLPKMRSCSNSTAFERHPKRTPATTRVEWDLTPCLHTRYELIDRKEPFSNPRDRPRRLLLKRRRRDKRSVEK